MDLISVMTAPSLRTTYLAATLEQIEREGGRDVRRLICYDGQPPNSDLGFGACYDRSSRGWHQTVKMDGPSGTRTMMWWVFARALEAGADRLLFCEDDLILAPRAIERALMLDVPDEYAFISFYDHKEFPADAPRPLDGLHTIEGMGRMRAGLWGSLCVLIPRRTLEFVTSRGPFDWYDPWPHKRTAGDCTLSWAVTKSPTPRWLLHVPSLVDHAGDVSSIEPRRIRKASWFDGR